MTGEITTITNRVADGITEITISEVISFAEYANITIATAARRFLSKGVTIIFDSQLTQDKKI
jgi:hypothetical protein